MLFFARNTAVMSMLIACDHQVIGRHIIMAAPTPITPVDWMPIIAVSFQFQHFRVKEYVESANITSEREGGDRPRDDDNFGHGTELSTSKRISHNL